MVNRCKECPLRKRPGKSRTQVPYANIICGVCIDEGAEKTKEHKEGRKTATAAVKRFVEKATTCTAAGCEEELHIGAYCLEHATARAETAQEYAIFVKATGLCRCGEKLDREGFRCKNCRRTQQTAKKLRIPADKAPLTIPILQQLTVKAQLVQKNLATAPAMNFENIAVLDTEHVTHGSDQFSSEKTFQWSFYVPKSGNSMIKSDSSGTQLTSTKLARWALDISNFLKEENVKTVFVYAVNNVDGRRLEDLFLYLPEGDSGPQVGYFEMYNGIINKLFNIRAKKGDEKSPTKPLYSPSTSLAVLATYLVNIPDVSSYRSSFKPDMVAEEKDITATVDVCDTWALFKAIALTCVGGKGSIAKIGEELLARDGGSSIEQQDNNDAFSIPSTSSSVLIPIGSPGSPRGKKRTYDAIKGLGAQENKVKSRKTQGGQTKLAQSYFKAERIKDAIKPKK